MVSLYAWAIVLAVTKNLLIDAPPSPVKKLRELTAVLTYGFGGTMLVVAGKGGRRQEFKR